MKRRSSKSLSVVELGALAAGVAMTVWLVRTLLTVAPKTEPS